MKQLWTEEHFSGFEGKYYHYPAFYESYLAIPKPYQKPYPPMLLPVDSQESFVPMGTQRLSHCHRGGTSPHNLRGSAVLKEDVKRYRQAWKEAGHPGDPTTVVRMPTLVADTQGGGHAPDGDPHAVSPGATMPEGRPSAAPTPARPAPRPTEEANLFGTPEEVVDSIQLLRENFSSDEIMFEVNWTASVPRDVVMNTMRLLTDKVIPQFK